MLFDCIAPIILPHHLGEVTKSLSQTPSFLCRLCTSWLMPGATQALEDRLLRLTQKTQRLPLFQAHHPRPRHRAQEPRRARNHLQEKPLHLPLCPSPSSCLLPPLSHTPRFILATTRAGPSSAGVLSPTLATLPLSTSALAQSLPPEGIMPGLMTGGTSLQASSLSSCRQSLLQLPPSLFPPASPCANPEEESDLCSVTGMKFHLGSQKPALLYPEA